MSGLVEAMREEYEDIFNKSGELTITPIKFDQLNSVEFETNGKYAFCYVSVKEKIFTTIEIVTYPEDEKIFKKVVKVNESVARRLDFLQINTEALDDGDKISLQEQGYEFGDGKYLGCKKLK